MSSLMHIHLDEEEHFKGQVNRRVISETGREFYTFEFSTHSGVTTENEVAIFFNDAQDLEHVEDVLLSMLAQTKQLILDAEEKRESAAQNKREV